MAQQWYPLQRWQHHEHGDDHSSGGGSDEVCGVAKAKAATAMPLAVETEVQATDCAGLDFWSPTKEKGMRFGLHKAESISVV